VKWFTKAAEQGHAKAQSYLGFCYFLGKGVAEDKAETVKSGCMGMLMIPLIAGVLTYLLL